MKKFFTYLMKSLRAFLRKQKRHYQAAWERFVFLQYKMMRRKRTFIHSTHEAPRQERWTALHATDRRDQLRPDGVEHQPSWWE